MHRVPDADIVIPCERRPDANNTSKVRPMILIIKKWDEVNHRMGFFTLGGGILNNIYMGRTKEEVVAGIMEINNNREKLHLDSLNWNWGR